tara:strand:+ start:1320 stop:1760 length:441 start_codon:yes stop_codon:yes gene_type:complete
VSKKRTDKSNYKSPSTGEYCTAAQYIAEIVCQRQAEKDNIGTPAYKFWNTEKWKKSYTHQIILANRLVKKYDERAIVKALKGARGKSIYSLRFPGLEDLIKKEQESLNRSGDEESIDIKDIDTNSKPRKPFGNKSSFSKLRDLDNE